MVQHVNVFAHIGSPGGVAKDLYKYWKDEGTRLENRRKAYERWGWAILMLSFLAALESVTRPYAPLGFIIGGLNIYGAIKCGIAEGTVESLLHKWDLDCAIELLAEQKMAESESRMYELRRPATEAELARRGELARKLETSLKPDDGGSA